MYTNYFVYQSNDELWTVRLINMWSIVYRPRRHKTWEFT